MHPCEPTGLAPGAAPMAAPCGALRRHESKSRARIASDHAIPLLRRLSLKRRASSRRLAGGLRERLPKPRGSRNLPCRRSPIIPHQTRNRAEPHRPQPRRRRPRPDRVHHRRIGRDRGLLDLLVAGRFRYPGRRRPVRRPGGREADRDPGGRERLCPLRGGPSQARDRHECRLGPPQERLTVVERPRETCGRW